MGRRVDGQFALLGSSAGFCFSFIKIPFLPHGESHFWDKEQG